MVKQSNVSKEDLDRLNKMFNRSDSADEVKARLEAADRAEEAIEAALVRVTGADHGVALVALMNVLAEHVVTQCIEEPPEVAAPMLSLEGLRKGLEMVNDALGAFALAACDRAEANGCTLVVRFRPGRRNTPETAPSTAPGAAGSPRDTGGSSGGDPSRERATDETTFGGRVSGSEG